MKAYPSGNTISPSNSDEEDGSKYEAFLEKLQHFFNNLDLDDGADNDDAENDIDPPGYYDVPRPQKRPGYSKPGKNIKIVISIYCAVMDGHGFLSLLTHLTTPSE